MALALIFFGEKSLDRRFTFTATIPSKWGMEVQYYQQKTLKNYYKSGLSLLVSNNSYEIASSFLLAMTW